MCRFASCWQMFTLTCQKVVLVSNVPSSVCPFKCVDLQLRHYIKPRRVMYYFMVSILCSNLCSQRNQGYPPTGGLSPTRTSSGVVWLLQPASLSTGRVNSRRRNWRVRRDESRRLWSWRVSSFFQCCCFTTDCTADCCPYDTAPNYSTKLQRVFFNSFINHG